MQSKQLDDKINAARTLRGRGRNEPLLSYKSVGGLLYDRVIANPDKPFLIFYNNAGERSEWSYLRFYHAVLNALDLLIESGIQPGDRIATLSGNYPETVVTYFAAWSYGATVVPLNAGEDEERLKYIVTNSHSRMIVTRPELENRAAAIRGNGNGFGEVQIITGLKSETHGKIHRHADFFRRVETDTLAFIVYTSGTTGVPKGVLLDHYNLLSDADALARWHGITNEQPMMCVLPIHHVNGTVVTLLTPLMAGSAVVLSEKFSTAQFFKRLAAERVGVVSVVPTMLAFLLEADASTDGLNLSGLHHIICGAGPLTVDLAMRFEERYNIPIVHGYGLSETTCYSCSLPAELSTDERRKWLSEYGYPAIGVPLEVNEMDIHSPEGEPVAAGDPGEIVIRGHNVMLGYYTDPSINEETFKFGWFRSGDQGFWLPGENGNRYFFITGRIKELIVRGGVNISPFEIDERLMAIPGVSAGIAVGFTHDLYGEEVGAYVQLDGSRDLTEREVIAECRKSLPFFKCPKVVLFGNQMPVTSTGKYQRNKLKHLFEGYRNGRFTDIG